MTAAMSLTEQVRSIDRMIVRVLGLKTTGVVKLHIFEVTLIGLGATS